MVVIITYGNHDTKQWPDLEEWVSWVYFRLPLKGVWEKHGIRGCDPCNPSGTRTYKCLVPRKRLTFGLMLGGHQIEIINVFEQGTLCFHFALGPTNYAVPIIGWEWDLNSGLHICKAGALLLEPLHQSILLWLFWRWGLANYLPRLASNLNPPDLNLPSS
jgi:hypothetical protein